jgi:hypothetical protein
LISSPPPSAHLYPVFNDIIHVLLLCYSHPELYKIVFLPRSLFNDILIRIPVYITISYGYSSEVPGIMIFLLVFLSRSLYKYIPTQENI